MPLTFDPDDVTIYSSGPVACSVCVPADYSRSQVVDAVNWKDPQLGDIAWDVTSDVFASGAPNPSPCEQGDGTKDTSRAHWTLTC